MMDILGEVRWLFSGVGVVAFGLIWNLRARMRWREGCRNLDDVITDILSSTPLVRHADAFADLVGLSVWFSGIIVSARRTDPSICRVEYKLRCGIHVVVLVPCEQFADIARLREGERRTMKGTIVGASRQVIEVAPFSEAK